MSTLLMVNLLIGLISNTFKKDMERGRQIWYPYYTPILNRKL